MASLQYKRVYVPMILSGRKTQTLRAKLPRGVKVGGPLSLCNGYRPGAKFATATCSAVDPVAVEDLTEDDARRDGFESLAALHAALDGLYADAVLYRIRWVDLSPVREQ